MKLLPANSRAASQQVRSGCKGTLRALAAAADGFGCPRHVVRARLAPIGLERNSEEPLTRARAGRAPSLPDQNVRLRPAAGWFSLSPP